MLVTILIFILVLALLVLAHEWGHFFVARRFGVHVEEFGFGFPPRLFSWQSKRNAHAPRYSVNLLPLGGFVKIKGETGEDSADPDSFAHQKIWKRVLILAAGVIMNFVLAIIIFMIVYGVGAPRLLSESGALFFGARIRDQKLEVLAVAPESPAALAGIKPGDSIVDIAQSTQIPFGEGVGVMSRTQITGELTGQKFRQYVRTHADERLSLRLRRDHQERLVEATPRVIQDEDFGETDAPVIGVVVAEVGIVSYPWHLLPYAGVRETVRVTSETLQAFGGVLVNLIKGAPLGAEIAGPVGVAHITARAARLGFVFLLQLVALLSINLAIINIVPFPALDGGRVLFAVIEKLRGRPVRAQLEKTIHMIGFILLMLLVVFVTFRDVGRLVGNS